MRELVGGKNTIGQMAAVLKSPMKRPLPLSFRRTNCIITASGIVTLCKRLYSRLQRVTIPDAVIIKFVLLKMGMLMLETCRGL